MTNPGIQAKRDERNDRKAKAKKREKAIRLAQQAKWQEGQALQAKLKAEFLERQARRAS